MARLSSERLEPMELPPRAVTERWLVTPHHPLYQVSDAGNVRRIWFNDLRCLVRPLKPYPGRHDYLKVQLGFRGPRIYVHTLVALAFLGPRPVGHDVDHIDFDRTNNTLINLRYLSRPLNSIRWKSRENGKNTWELTKYEPVPDDHIPMTEQESADAARERTEHGWP